MFSTPYSLKKRTGKFDLERGAYLKQLLEEFESDKTDEEKKEQVLANLGNFAYDPINYEYFRRFNIIDIFVRNLKEFRACKKRNQYFSLKILDFSISAICNLCLDSKNKEFLFKNDAINLMLYSLAIELNSNSVEIVLNIITFLIFVFDEKTRNEIINYSDENINFMALITAFSKSKNKRLSNLATIFLENCFKT